MKKYLACVLLCTAIMLISLGIHTVNIIITGIGGALAGAYNAIICNDIQTKLKEK